MTDRIEATYFGEPTNITYQELFLDYFNNYLTVERFADHYGFTVRRAQEIIDIGRNSHEAQFEAAGE